MIDITKKLKKERTRNTKKEPEYNYESMLREIDQQIEKIKTQMDEFAFDSVKLNELYKEKSKLENDYEEIFLKLEKNES